MFREIPFMELIMEQDKIINILREARVRYVFKTVYGEAAEVLVIETESEYNDEGGHDDYVTGMDVYDIDANPLQPLDVTELSKSQNLDTVYILMLKACYGDEDNRSLAIYEKWKTKSAVEKAVDIIDNYMLRNLTREAGSYMLGSKETLRYFREIIE